MGKAPWIPVLRASAFPTSLPWTLQTVLFMTAYLRLHVPLLFPELAVQDLEAGSFPHGMIGNRIATSPTNVLWWLSIFLGDDFCLDRSP